MFERIICVLVQIKVRGHPVMSIIQFVHSLACISGLICNSDDDDDVFFLLSIFSVALVGCAQIWLDQKHQRLQMKVYA